MMWSPFQAPVKPLAVGAPGVRQEIVGAGWFLSAAAAEFAGNWGGGVELMGTKKK